MKQYDIKSPGIGYKENIKAIEDVLLTAGGTFRASDVTRQALASIIWNTLCMERRGPGFDGRIRFSTEDILDAKEYLLNDLAEYVLKGVTDE